MAEIDPFATMMAGLDKIYASFAEAAPTILFVGGVFIAAYIAIKFGKQWIFPVAAIFLIISIPFFAWVKDTLKINPLVQEIMDEKGIDEESAKLILEQQELSKQESNLE